MPKLALAPGWALNGLVRLKESCVNGMFRSELSRPTPVSAPPGGEAPTTSGSRLPCTYREKFGFTRNGGVKVVLPVLGLGLRLDSDYWRRR